MSEGSDVFCVPEKCWINSQTIARSSSARVSSKSSGPPPRPSALAKCHQYEKVAVWLAEEKAFGESSFHYPHLAMLPDREIFKRFHPAYLEDYALSHDIDYWSSWLQQLRHCHAGRASPTFDDAKLAYVQLVTRQFVKSGIVPLADMLNTGPGTQLNVKEHDNEAGDFCMKAKRDLIAGEELIVDYGGHHYSPMLMFVIYGFALGKEDHVTHGDARRADFKVPGYDIKNPSDDCAGLGPQEFSVPEHAGPVLLNYKRFANRFCRESVPSVRSEEDHVDL